MSDDRAMQHAAQAIRDSRRLVVLTGAGISKESGIPTFRDALDGLWAQYDPARLATRQGFASDPKLVWDWYDYRRGLLAQAEPNPGHYAIAALENHLPQLVVITQNIDGLHQQAGSRDVIALHGDIRLNKCFVACQGEPTYVDVAQLTWNAQVEPPRCPHCGAFVRPDVVWFGELLPPLALDRALSLCRAADVTIVAGTSGTVQPAAHMPFVAAEHGAVVIEVNPERTPISAAARWHLAGPSGVILPQLLDLVTGARDA